MEENKVATDKALRERAESLRREGREQIGEALQWLLDEKYHDDAANELAPDFAKYAAFYAETECSRLASRVEELERVLREVVATEEKACRRDYDEDDYRCALIRLSELSEKALAGAHAEEKPRNPNFCRCSHGKQAHEKHGFCDQLRCHCKRFESEG